MKNSPIVSAAGNAPTARLFSPGASAALFAGLISVCLLVAPGRAQPANNNQDGEEVLTRGPVHEAFAGVVSFNPEPGIVVRTRPPELIEELPPEEKPDGDDVAWIPGYWGWDDERNDYLWISGTWRVLPPGREWMAGYWRETGQGYQWISGYWADAEEQETTYLPPPPLTLEVGPNVAAPSLDYGWTPGCWVWQQSRYAWRTGYWAEGRSDWAWIPAYYVWTPRGVIFVEGFWDYPVERRGLLFAPVYYQSRGYARRGYSYSPRIVINLSFFNDNLFLRPSYHHYYFGDYYGSRYEQGGFYASFSFQSSRSGYDPFYSHSRWEHREDRDWENRYQASYRDRRDHEAARPPRTWSAQLTVTVSTSTASRGPTRVVIAAPIEQLARNRDNPVRFQAVAQGDRQKLAQRGRDVQQSRDQRRTVEAKAGVTIGRNPNESVAPAKVAAPRSPIMAKQAGQRDRNQSPPERPKAPKPDPQVQPRADSTDRPANGDRRNTPPERQRDPERNIPAVRRDAGSRGTDAQPAADQRPGAVSGRTREESQREAQDAQKKAQQDAEKRTRDAAAKSQATERTQQQAEERANAAAARNKDDSERKAQQAQQRANESAEKNRRDTEERTKASAAKAQEDSQRRGQQAQQQADERGKADRAREDSERKAQQAQQAQQRANESADKNRRDTDERTRASAAKAQEESQRKGQQAQQQAEERGKADRAREESQQRGQEAREQEQQRAKESAAKAQQDTEQRAQASAANAREDSQRKEQQAQQAQARAKQDAARRAPEAKAPTKERPAPKEKTAEDDDDEAKNDKDKPRRQ